MTYVFETMNEAAVGPFPTRKAAKAWLVRIIPPEDHQSTDDITGWRIGSLAEVNKWIDPQWETTDEVEARYRQVYAEYYPGFRVP